MARLVILLFSGLFMLGFGGGGLVAGVAPAAATIWSVLHTSYWKAVPAQVVDVRLEEGLAGGGERVYAVRAHYRYVVDDRAYEGHRVGLLDWGKDADEAWHRDRYDRLVRSMATEEPLIVRVDPLWPAWAIVDRSVHWSMLFLHLCFALFFTPIGYFAAKVFWAMVVNRV